MQLSFQFKIKIRGAFSPDVTKCTTSVIDEQLRSKFYSPNVYYIYPNQLDP